MKKFFLGVVPLVVFCVCAALIAGCESSSKSGTLGILPGTYVLMQGAQRVLVFTVVDGSGGTNAAGTAQLGGMSLPVDWSVSNRELGEIIATDGQRGTYTRTALGGVNIVTARDQSGSEVIATVEQR